MAGVIPIISPVSPARGCLQPVPSRHLTLEASVERRGTKETHLGTILQSRYPKALLKIGNSTHAGAAEVSKLPQGSI
jgi:hypothetical protein